MGAFTLRWIDVAAALCWAVCAAFALTLTLGDVPQLRPWVVVAAGVAVLTTGCAWLSCRLDRLENHVYTEGMRAGLEAKQVVRLPEQR